MLPDERETGHKKPLSEDHKIHRDNSRIEKRQPQHDHDVGRGRQDRDKGHEKNKRRE